MRHWLARRLADWLARHRGIRVSHDSIAVLWRRFCLHPHRSEGFKFSTDRALAAKIRDVVGLYVDPPQDAVVVCVDEKSRAPRGADDAVRDERPAAGCRGDRLKLEADRSSVRPLVRAGNGQPVH